MIGACSRAGPEAKAFSKAALFPVGEVIRSSATSRMSVIDTRSAAGYETRVRQRGIAVAQRLRKTTGKRGDYGSLQMKRALLPALYENRDTAERALEHAMDRMASHFER